MLVRLATADTCTLSLPHLLTVLRHILCVDCSRILGLSDAPLSQRRCPICNTELPNVDDAILTRLNPSEEYKTSILSGLDPGTILECASRAIGFWVYQTTREMYAKGKRCGKLSALN
jgi:E3 ubiquitin-protein ligase CCNP1IP1